MLSNGMPEETDISGGKGITVTYAPLSLIERYTYNVGQALKHMLRAEYAKDREREREGELRAALYYLRRECDFKLEIVYTWNVKELPIVAAFRDKSEFIKTLLSCDGEYDVPHMLHCIKAIEEELEEIELNEEEIKK